MTHNIPQEALALARVIAADTWGLTGANRQAVINGEWDEIRQVKCALAAIIKTTELAAKMAEGFVEKNETWAGKAAANEISAALRAMEHLK